MTATFKFYAALIVVLAAIVALSFYAGYRTGAAARRMPHAASRP
jgi:hypothetical protein